MIQMSRSAGNADLHDTRNFQALTLVPVEVTLFKMKIKMDPKLTEEDFIHSNNIHDIVTLILFHIMPTPTCLGKKAMLLLLLILFHIMPLNQEHG